MRIFNQLKKNHIFGGLLTIALGESRLGLIPVVL